MRIIFALLLVLSTASSMASSGSSRGDRLRLTAALQERGPLSRILLLRPSESKLRQISSRLAAVAVMPPVSPWGITHLPTHISHARHCVQNAYVGIQNMIAASSAKRVRQRQEHARLYGKLKTAFCRSTKKIIFAAVLGSFGRTVGFAYIAWVIEMPPPTNRERSLSRGV